MQCNNSEALFRAAMDIIPGGVNSPVRAFQAVGINPIFVKKAHGSYLTDMDGNTYLDYICSWGPLIFGHSPEYLLDGLSDAVRRGITYGLPTDLELRMAQLISNAYPAAEMVRMVNSGTEATMSAIRVARGYTGRNKIVKFEGCYHGHNDALLVKAGSGAATFSTPTSAGIPEAVAADTLVCRYNDIPMLENLFDRYGNEIACIITEPIAGNMGLVPGKAEFLQKMRMLCDRYETVLIFDEVISGFRAAFGGASEIYGIEPDMVCFGKIIGSGLPVGAYAGKKKIMTYVSPAGPVYQAGTLSGNPLAMFLGIKTLEILQAQKSIYEDINCKALALKEGIEHNIEDLNVPCCIVQSGSLLCLFFEESIPNNYDEVKLCNTEKYGSYFRKMLNSGILLPPSQFECMFLSAAHSKEDIEKTVALNYQILKELF